MQDISDVNIVLVSGRREQFRLRIRGSHEVHKLIRVAMESSGVDCTFVQEIGWIVHSNLATNRLCSESSIRRSDSQNQRLWFTTAPSLLANALTLFGSHEMPRRRPLNPLNGITLEMMLEQLMAHMGWEAMSMEVPIRCFIHDPSIQSSLRFLRKTPWARTKVEWLYRNNQKKMNNPANDHPEP